MQELKNKIKYKIKSIYKYVSDTWCMCVIGIELLMPTEWKLVRSHHCHVILKELSYGRQARVGLSQWNHVPVTLGETLKKVRLSD